MPSSASPAVEQPLAPVRRWGPLLLSVGLGTAYGIAARIAFAAKGGPRNDSVFGVMTASFLFGAPLAIGLIYALRFPRDYRLRWSQAILGAVGTALLALAATIVLAIEGSICVIIASPIFALLAAIGGVVGKLIHDSLAPRPPARGALLCVAGLLPFALAPIEKLNAPPSEVRTVANTIRVQASPEAVWREIRSVPLIRRDELPITVSHLIGLPRPLEATLSHDGPGGLRIATFERGLKFREQVTDWQPEQRISFTIKAEDVPPTALDEHVAVGGPYFDVLQGTYRIERLGPHVVLLHLESRQRLSMLFNGYAAMWTDFLMRDLQQAILRVVAKRAESHDST